jgi:hypothetical protein
LLDGRTGITIQFKRPASASIKTNSRETLTGNLLARCDRVAFPLL